MNSTPLDLLKLKEPALRYPLMCDQARRPKDPTQRNPQHDASSRLPRSNSPSQKPIPERLKPRTKHRTANKSNTASQQITLPSLCRLAEEFSNSRTHLSPQNSAPRPPKKPLILISHHRASLTRLLQNSRTPELRTPPLKL